MGHKCRTSEVKITAHWFNDGRSHSLKSATTQVSSAFCEVVRLQKETWSLRFLAFAKNPITVTRLLYNAALVTLFALYGL